MNNIFAPKLGSPLLNHCPESLPADFYFDASHFEREQKQIWAKSWVYAGRANDFAPLVVKRINIAGQNLILVKDDKGTINCFHNTCRHRGAELCSVSETQLKSKLISCPYHDWSYDLAGNLVRIPFATATADFKKAEHGLFKVHSHVWNGFVFVCLAENPPDFLTAPDAGVDALNNWPMDELVTGHTLIKEMACNWKIFWENYNECLHCPGIHPELCDLVPIYRNGIMAENEAADWPAERTPRAKLKDGARSWTVNGKACGPEFENLSALQREEGHFFVTLLPTMYIVAHADYVRAVSLRPLGPERTELRAEWLFLKSTLADPRFNLKNVTDFATTVMLQDGAACEMNQRGLRASVFKHGRLMPQEFDVYKFQQWIRKNLSE